MRFAFSKLIIVLFGLALFSLIGVTIWQKERIFPPKIKTPVTMGEITPELSMVLAKAGLAVSGQPLVLGDAVYASVSGIQVIFSIDKELSSQVRALQLALGRLTIDKWPREIDLRFNKIVIRY